MYRRTVEGWLKHVDFMILDLVCLQISFILAFWVRHGFSNPYQSVIYRNIAIILCFLDVLVALFFNSFKNIMKRESFKELGMTLEHTVLVLLLAVFYMFSIRMSESYSRVTIYLMGCFYLLLGYVARTIWKAYILRKISTEGKRSLMIITEAHMVDEVVDGIKNHNYETFCLVGLAVMDQDMQGQEISGIPIVADRNCVTEYICREWVDEVFINLPQERLYPRELVRQLVSMGVVVHIGVARNMQEMGQKQIVEKIGNYTVLTSSINYITPVKACIKRAVDILGGLVGCFITLLLFLVLAPAIYIKSPGPIFFKQERVGRNGKKFKMYKFRSMYLDAEERKKELMDQNRVKDGMMFKLDWDPRIIGSRILPDGTPKKGIGNYIRDWSLDEFPQFINVLKGDMSLVGTRPPTVDEWEKYELHHRARLAMKPGITGMWQVSGRSNITDFEDVVKLDTQYLMEWSMLLDFKILLKTVAVVFKKEGSM